MQGNLSGDYLAAEGRLLGNRAVREWTHSARDRFLSRMRGGSLKRLLFSYSALEGSFGEIIIQKPPIDMEVAYFKNGSMAVLNVDDLRFLPDV